MAESACGSFVPFITEGSQQVGRIAPVPLGCLCPRDARAQQREYTAGFLLLSSFCSQTEENPEPRARFLLRRKAGAAQGREDEDAGKSPICSPLSCSQLGSAAHLCPWGFEDPPCEQKPLPRSLSCPKTAFG